MGKVGELCREVIRRFGYAAMNAPGPAVYVVDSPCGRHVVAWTPTSRLLILPFPTPEVRFRAFTGPTTSIIWPTCKTEQEVLALLQKAEEVLAE